MTNTIVEKMYPQETFIHKIEELGFKFETYGWSGEGEEDYGMQDYFFSFPCKPYEDEDEKEGLFKLIIHIHDKVVGFDLRINEFSISEKSRIGISKVIHELAKRTPKDMEKITFHGALIKDMEFYEKTVNGLNKDKLIEIAKNLEFEAGGSNYDLPIFGLEGKIFAEVLVEMHQAFKVYPFGEPIEYTTALGFKDKKLTILSQVYIGKYFSTNEWCF